MLPRPNFSNQPNGKLVGHILTPRQRNCPSNLLGPPPCGREPFCNKTFLLLISLSMNSFFDFSRQWAPTQTEILGITWSSWFYFDLFSLAEQILYCTLPLTNHSLVMLQVYYIHSYYSSHFGEFSDDSHVLSGLSHANSLGCLACFSSFPLLQ